jgi:hypothetical protein
MDLRSLIPTRCRSRLMVAVGLGAFAFFTLQPSACAEKQNKAHKENRRTESREIEGLETQWRDAMVKGDTAQLDKLLADDFWGISANGTLSDKQQYLRRLSARQNQFTTIDVMDTKMRVQPANAVVTSQARVVGQMDGRPVEGIFRYTKVYARDQGRWVVTNFEATRVSGPREHDNDMQRGMPLKSSLAQRQ